MTDRPRKERQANEINIPLVKPESVERAEKLSNPTIELEGDTGRVTKSATAVKKDELRREAKRIAAIVDATEREDAVFSVLDSLIQSVLQLRNLAHSFVAIARQCEIANRQMNEVTEGENPDAKRQSNQRPGRN